MGGRQRTSIFFEKGAKKEESKSKYKKKRKK